MITHNHAVRVLQHAYPGKEWTLDDMGDTQKLTWFCDEDPPSLDELAKKYEELKPEFDAEDAKRAALRAFSQKYSHQDFIRAVKGDTALLQEIRAAVNSAGL